MTHLTAATIDATAVRRLRLAPVGPGDKALPTRCWGMSLDEVADLGLRLEDLPTPLVTVSRSRLSENIATFATWTDTRRLAFAPHGKTTMSPELWSRQLEAGAAAITVATEHQLWVALAFGVTRVLVANSLARAAGVAQLAAHLDQHPEVEVCAWVDSLEAVAALEAGLASAHRRFPVLVELGSDKGRTGARGVVAARRVAEAVARSRRLELRGTAGYEAVLTHGTDAASLCIIRDYLGTLVGLHRDLMAGGLLEASHPWSSAGGSTYFDLVAEVLSPLVEEGSEVVLRSGAYLLHDDGFCARTSPLGSSARTDGPPFQAALHAWGRVLSVPEAGLALVEGGKRDWSHDLGLPEPQQLRRGNAVFPLDAATTQLDDQHAYVRWTPAPGGVTPAVGEILRFGLSHPCTTVDRWRSIPVVDDPDTPNPRVVDVLRTLF